MKQYVDVVHCYNPLSFEIKEDEVIVRGNYRTQEISANNTIYITDEKHYKMLEYVYSLEEENKRLKEETSQQWDVLTLLLKINECI